MKTHEIILIILLSILFIIIIDKIKSNKNKKIDNSIKNKLNSPTASIKEIKKAYEYESGKNPVYINKERGEALEYEVFKILYKNRGKVLSNLYVEKYDNKTSEVDIVYIHKTGIYVVECKDINAFMIIGKESDKKWTCIYSKHYKRAMYNPLKQNYSHIVSLKKILKYPDNYYTSIVVVSSKNVKCTYSSNNQNYNQKIVTINKLRNYIDQLVDKKEEKLSEEEILKSYKILHEKYSNASTVIKKNHKENIRKIINKK